MTTVRNVIDRLMRTFLTPPDAQYAQVQLGSAITSPTVTTVQLGAFTIVEDETLIRQGALLEAGLELMRVVDYDPLTKIATVERGEYSTTATTHAKPSLLSLNPLYPMQSVFEAVRDNILSLYPSLWTVNTDELSNVGSHVFSIPDDLAVEVIETFGNDGYSPVNMDARIVDYHPLAGGRAVITNKPASTLWVRYRRRMGVVTSMEDTLGELGVEDVWAGVVMVGAAADLFVARDLPAAQTEWVKGLLISENIRVGSRMSISGGLAQYRNILLERFSREMKAESSSGITVHMNTPFTTVT